MQQETPVFTHTAEPLGALRGAGEDEREPGATQEAQAPVERGTWSVARVDLGTPVPTPWVSAGMKPT